MICSKSLTIRWQRLAQGKLTISYKISFKLNDLTLFSTYGKILCSWGLAGIAFIFVCVIFFQRQIKNGIEELRWQINRSYGDIHLWYLRRQRKRSGQTEEVGSFRK